MENQIKIYNTLTRKKEVFQPLEEGYVGMYVCGPTVYSDVHLGNCRTFIFFDIVHRYLKQFHKVRYVRNITDVGHLTDDGDAGEDKILKKATAEKLEPMEIVQRYTNGFHDVMDVFNVLRPSIEPTATGHLLEQIEMIERIIDNGYGYVANGSVYFDVLKYAEAAENNPDVPNYGQLSGKVLEDLRNNTRALDGQSEKRNPVDFAIWKNAPANHLMKWQSPWGLGFPGWHLECSVMSTKYLGETFDIHGGGMDLKFPHHECEIAQSVGSGCASPVRYWIHTNMLTMNGTKMSKSLGNSFLPHELFAGDHELLDNGYSPMTTRFFFMQAHYSSTVDFSNDALKAAEKGYKRLMNAQNLLGKLEHPGNKKPKNVEEDTHINKTCDLCYEHMNDDFNTAMTLADLFELSSKINAFYNKQLPINSISQATFERMTTVFNTFITEVLGLKNETLAGGGDESLTDDLMQLIIKLRAEARAKKDWGTADIIRDDLKNMGVKVKDGKEGTTWNV
ncbi:MAG: cysteine--tRNA ligase [Chitinophagales bacterium]